MLKTISRLFAMVMLVLAMMMPTMVAAQNATPQASPVASPVATPVTAPGVEAAVSWLIDQQQEDGSWLGLSGEPDAGTTVDAIITLGAAQAADIDVGDSIDNAIAWLDTDENAATYVEGGTGQAAKLVLALIAADAESLEIGGVTPLDLLIEGQDTETGLYGSGLYDHSYALMALAATDSEIPANAIEFVGTVQAANGGFAWDGSTDESMADSNTTAMIVQALVAAGGGESDVVAAAIDYLRLTVNEQGAAYSIGAEADANSTALVAQAYLAVDEDATHLITSLGSFQNASGAYHWMHSDSADNAFSTMQVIPAAVGVTLPVIPGEVDLDVAA